MSATIADPFAAEQFALGPSWQPVDLTAVLTGGHIDPAPSVLNRDDGPALFYEGKVHSVSGQSESLKSWLLLVAAAQLLSRRERVVWLDFEDSAASVIGRLLALGCGPAAIASHFSYVRPTEPLETAAGTSIHSDGLTIRPQPPRLVVVDGVTEAMSLHGLEPNSNSDVAAFMNQLTKPLARGALRDVTGPAVVLIDHLVKNRENQGRFAIGAQHKLAGLDGAAYLVDLKQPFGHGKHGITRIDVAKDRPGRVREHAAGNHIADLHLRSEPDGSVIAELHPPDQPAPGEPWRPTYLMEQVSRLLETTTTPLTGRDITDRIKSKAANTRAAITALINDGYITVEPGPHRAQLHSSTKPYRQEDTP